MIEDIEDDFEVKGYNLEIKVFDDMVSPSIALEEVSIDANYYQFEPCIDAFNSEEVGDLVLIGAVIPMF